MFADEMPNKAVVHSLATVRTVYLFGVCFTLERVENLSAFLAYYT